MRNRQTIRYLLIRPTEINSKAHQINFYRNNRRYQKKLEYSQNILAGVATADFDKIVANAQSMRNLSKVEGFVRRQTPGYQAQLQFFQHSTDEIIRQAKKDNLEGATLAFTQLTISCVNCHKHLRETK